MVFPRNRAVIFVHGCYWHSHGCYKSTVPKSRRKFWQDKFSANRDRDERNITLLREHGWRVMVVWECALAGINALPLNGVTEQVRAWLAASSGYEEVPSVSTD